jgi:hypothetical protein
VSLLTIIPATSLPLQVDWAAPPRAPKEFFAKFTPPKTAAKWTSRLKCNVYFYRTNYFIILGIVLTAAFVRNPAALLAVALLCFDLLLFNDTFATSVRCLPLPDATQRHPTPARLRLARTAWKRTHRQQRHEHWKIM